MEHSPNFTVRPVNANPSVILYAVCFVMCIAQYICMFYFRSCQDVDECEKFKDRNLCVGICVNQAGSYTCQCPEGYRIGSDGRTCQGILKAGMHKIAYYVQGSFETVTAPEFPCAYFIQARPYNLISLLNEFILTKVKWAQED
jgi:hypothetical protein